MKTVISKEAYQFQETFNAPKTLTRSVIFGLPLLIGRVGKIIMREGQLLRDGGRSVQWQD